MIAHVTKLHEAHQQQKVDEDVVVAETKNVASIQIEAFSKVMDDAIVPRVVINLTNTGVMDKIGEVSNATMVDEVEPHIQNLASKQSTTSNKATS